VSTSWRCWSSSSVRTEFTRIFLRAQESTRKYLTGSHSDNNQRLTSNPHVPTATPAAPPERLFDHLRHKSSPRDRPRAVVHRRAAKTTMLQRGMAITRDFRYLSDADLVARVGVLAASERSATAEPIVSLAELDARRLYLGAGCSSLFTYCTQVLRLSESAASARITAARTARHHPRILERLIDGSLTLTSVSLLAPVLTEDNSAELLESACHRSKREVEQLVARVRPQAPAPETLRKMPAPVERPVISIAPDVTSEASATRSPAPAPASADSATERRAIVQPLAPELFKVQFTLSREGHDNLRRAQDLMRHGVPNGSLAVIFERALALLVEDLEKKRLAATIHPRHQRLPVTSGSRHIPAEVKRVVWKRDEGRCAFVGTHGRCTERGFLEVHHLIPFADGGEATVDNLQLRRRPQPTRGEVVVRRSRREYSERAATMNEQRRSRVDRSATAPP